MLQASRTFKAARRNAAWTAAIMLGASAFSAQAQTVDHAAAYYHYSLGHMYADLASINGSSEYIKKAIENYKLAIKEDPQTPMLGEELSELYIQTGRLREAQSDAEEALKANPNDVNAHRMLGRIFTRQIGDSQEHRIDEAMLKKSIEEYKKITELDPKDVDSWLMLGRLHKVAQNSVDAQNAYKKALEVDPDNEDALTGLAMVYADLGDNTSAADLLKKLAAKNPSPPQSAGAGRGLRTDARVRAGRGDIEALAGIESSECRRNKAVHGGGSAQGGAVSSGVEGVSGSGGGGAERRRILPPYVEHLHAASGFRQGSRGGG